MDKSFTKVIFKRKIPQIIGSYIVASTSMILFIDWLRISYGFPKEYVTLALFGAISILPSVVILAYFHGAPGKDEWSRIEKIGIPINTIFIIMVIMFGYLNEWWLYTIPEIEDYSEIYIADLYSTQENENLFKNMLSQESLDVEYFSSISSESLQDLHENLIQYSISRFYPTRMIYNTNDIRKKYLESGKTMPFIDKNIVPMWGIIYDMVDTTISMTSNFDNIWKLKKHAKFDLGVYIHLYEFKIDNSQNLFILIDYNTNEYDGYALKADNFISNYKDFSRDVVDNINNKILKITVQKDLEGTVIEHNDNQVLFSYTSKDRLLINTIMKGYRNYHAPNIFSVRIKDIENFEYHCKNILSDKKEIDYCKNILNNKYGYYLMSYDELNDLKKGKHKIFNDKNVTTILPISIDVKVIEIYDSTGIGEVINKTSPIKFNPGDILRVK